MSWLTGGQKEPESLFGDMLASVRRGRIDLALKQAAPHAGMAGAGGTPTQFLARECSDHAARFYTDGRAARERAIDLAVSGATFQLPGRGAINTIKPEYLHQSFWLREVSDQHERAESILRFSRASLALRGFESAETLDDLERRCAEGDAAAERDVVAAARDYQLLSRSVVTRLQTSQCSAVLQAFVARTFAADITNTARCPVLFSLLLKAGRSFSEAFGGSQFPEPLAEVERSSRSLSVCRTLGKEADSRQAAAVRQMTIIAEVTSEAAVSLLPNPKDGLALLDVAELFFKVECPLVERQNAIKIFRATADQITERAK